MAHVLHTRSHVVRDDPDVIVDDSDYGYNIAARAVSILGGVVMALLALRFVLSLLGANRGNGFADAVYTLSHPFVAPFFGLFNYQEQFGVVRFEFETLIAMLFWGFVAWLLVRLVSLPSRHGTDV